MSDYGQKWEMAKDDQGNILAYDGTTDLAEFVQWFDQFCEARGLGGVVSRINYEQPVPPLDSIGRIAMGIPTERDPGNVATFHKANAHFLTKCQQVLVLLKAAVSSSIRMQWQGTHNEAYRIGNRDNLERLRAELYRKYGGWTDAKGQLNFLAAEALGDIISVDSCDKIFYAFQVLINERNNWNNADELFRPSYYRSWLIKRIAKWELFRRTYLDMKLTPAMTYELGKEQVLTLVDQERTEMALAKRTGKATIKSTGEPIVPQDFSMTVNTVSMSREEYDDMVAAAAAGTAYGPARAQTGSDMIRGVCFLCKLPGHRKWECPLRVRQMSTRTEVIQSQPQPQSNRPAFVKPTAAQNELIQAYLRGETTQLGQLTGQSSSRKRGAVEKETSEAPPWKRTSTPGWVPRGSKPTAAASVESDEVKGDEFMGAAGVFTEDDDDDFDPEVYRPSQDYSS